jgi:hypothetical protein
VDVDIGVAVKLAAKMAGQLAQREGRHIPIRRLRFPAIYGRSWVYAWKPIVPARNMETRTIIHLGCAVLLLSMRVSPPWEMGRKISPLDCRPNEIRLCISWARG